MADTYELDLEPGADDFAEDEMMIDNGTQFFFTIHQ